MCTAYCMSTPRLSPFFFWRAQDRRISDPPKFISSPESWCSTCFVALATMSSSAKQRFTTFACLLIACILLPRLLSAQPIRGRGTSDIYGDCDVVRRVTP